LHTAQDAGDHTIFIAEVEDVVTREGNPLLYFRANYRAIGPALRDGETGSADSEERGPAKPAVRKH
jgi:flavin reductase (DIM6/NTAB) family NADH-FMN oxidoreductase RutF